MMPNGMVVIEAHPRARGARCAWCGRVSARVHSHYLRRVADLPVSGRSVVVWLTMRRFFCDGQTAAPRPPQRPIAAPAPQPGSAGGPTVSDASFAVTTTEEP